MRFLLASIALFSFSALAQENAFRLNVGSLATGASIVNETLETKGGEDQETTKYNISFGYLRHVGKNFQVVGNIGYKFENTKLDDEESEDNDLTIEVGGLYNIGDNIKSAFYGGILYYMSERFQGDYNDTVDTESEGSVSGFELTLGKRFNLIENLSYVVSVDYITGLSFGGDYGDVYEGGSITRFNFATFEYYF